MQKSGNSSENIDYYLDEFCTILEINPEENLELIKKLKGLIYQISEESYHNGLSDIKKALGDKSLHESGFFDYLEEEYFEELRNSLDTDELDFMMPDREGCD